MPRTIDDYDCFFCCQRPATHVFAMRTPWPPPMKPDAVLARYNECRDNLSIEQMARIVFDHVNNLRRIHNQAMCN
jgi:hypothetical protein